MIELVIECKRRSGENWILYVPDFDTPIESKDKLGHICMTDHSVLRYANEYEKLKLYDTDTRDSFWRTSHHSLAKSPGIARAGRSMFKNEDSFYNACQQVLDAHRFTVISSQARTDLDISSLKKGKKTVLKYWRIYPVIVFDGPLWKVKYSRRKQKITPLEWIEYRIVHHNQDYSIDIVRWDCFGKYLSVINKEVEELDRLASK